MNKSKLISVAVLCALALGACVDDKESASVTALREAKTSYFKSQSDYQAAQAELARINAEVTKAKAESEIKLAELQAKAAAAKTEAEAAQIKQLMQQEADRFAAELAGIEAKAKADAAYYEAAYQEYLNQLAAEQRKAVMEQQKDLVEVINKYKVVLGNIRTAESSVRNYTLQLAQKQQEKAAAVAGNALVLAKQAVAKQEAQLNLWSANLENLKLFEEADANAQKDMIEKMRAGLTAKAEAAKAAKDKYDKAILKQDTIEANQDTLESILYGRYSYELSDRIAGKLDTLAEAWDVLNEAERATHSNSIYTFYLRDYDNIQNNVNYDNIKAIEYYEWEANKLITDMNSELAELRADSLAIDTLAVATARLQPLFVAFEKAVAENDKAYADMQAKEKLYNQAVEAEQDLTGDKLAAAKAETAKALAAWTKAQNVYYGYQDPDDITKHIDGTSEIKAAAESAYITKREANKLLEAEVKTIKEAVEDQVNAIANVKAAKAVCFGTLPARIADLFAQIEKYDEEIDALLEANSSLYVDACILKEDYENDKAQVNQWDIDVQNGNNSNWVLQRIATLEGNITTGNAELQNLKDILADPDKIAEEYAKTINDAILNLESQLDEAQKTLDAEKAKAAAYKATIDAWSAESAE